MLKGFETEAGDMKRKNTIVVAFAGEAHHVLERFSVLDREGACGYNAIRPRDNMSAPQTEDGQVRLDYETE